jgi:5,5'-dehydrodivanillate O-demethylase
MVQNQTVQRVSSQSDDFTSTEPGSPARAFLCRTWLPIYHAVDLKTKRPVPLRIMNENFTLYRGEGGDVFLVEPRCPHRGTQLSTAWVDGNALRCFYHGWKFESDGRCSEQPAEESSFCHKVSIKTWPVKEYLGLIFAFLGDGDPPAFPRYPEFENFAGMLEIDTYLRRCNYFQAIDNALDMSHVAFTHGNNQVAFDKIGLGRSLDAEESDWGVTYTFTRDDGEKRIQQFGMPNVLHLTALPTDPEIGWQESLFWWVPIDDTSHLQFSLHRVPATGETAKRLHQKRLDRRARIDIAHQDACDMILSGRARMDDFDFDRVDLVRLQDDVAQLGQGAIADRSAEHLGRADVGLTAIRRLWRRELGNFVSNRPLKAWKKTDNIKVRAWKIQGALSNITGSSIATSRDATPEIVDVRPLVEVEMQMKALHAPPRGS